MFPQFCSSLCKQIKTLQYYNLKMSIGLSVFSGSQSFTPLTVSLIVKYPKFCNKKISPTWKRIFWWLAITKTRKPWFENIMRKKPKPTCMFVKDLEWKYNVVLCLAGGWGLNKLKRDISVKFLEVHTANIGSSSLNPITASFWDENFLSWRKSVHCLIQHNLLLISRPKKEEKL